MDLAAHQSLLKTIGIKVKANNMSEKKKVLISTFNNSKSNYGAVFQSYALSCFIDKLGFEAYFLTMAERSNKNVCKTKKSFKMRIKQIIYKCLTASSKKAKKKRTEKFEHFTENTQRQLCYADYNELLKSVPKADVYLSGSDQVWNPKNIHDELFLSFAPENAVCVSYAASMGYEKIPSENEKLFASYISKYSHVSVREDTMKPIIEQYTTLPVYQHIDPVFLLNPEEWLVIEKKYAKLKYENYVLLYLIECNKSDEKRICALKKKLKIPFVLVTLGGRKKKFANQTIVDASPEEFIYLLRNSSAVIASSFHGTALSILFNKPFISISGKDKPSRIESLLRHFSLETRNSADCDLYSPINYESINKRIEEDRAESKKYLLEALS